VSIATFSEHRGGSSVEPSENWGFSQSEQIPWSLAAIKKNNAKPSVKILIGAE